MNIKNIITTYGMPGSGKTSATTILTQMLNKYDDNPEFVYVGAGDVARKLAETDEETRIELAAGRIAPPSKMRRAILDSVDYYNTILDGYPRYWQQLADLFYEFGNYDITHVVFGCKPDIAVQRLRKRQRADDTDYQIGNRMQTYREETLPVISYLMMNYPDRVVNIPQTDSPYDSAKLAFNYLTENIF